MFAKKKLSYVRPHRPTGRSIFLLVIPPQHGCFRGYTGIGLSVFPSMWSSLYLCPYVYQILVSVKALFYVAFSDSSR